ncbi:hypothetical protein RYX36_000105 [Vicia faba]
MSSRANQSKCSRYAVGSSSHSRQSAEAEHVEFDNTRFTGPFHQARFYSLAEQQVWPEKIFTLNPQEDYRYFVDDIEKRKWGVLLTPLTEMNFDIVREFYANAIPIEDVCYSYYSVVWGRAVSFDRNLVSQYLGHPLTLQRGELCSYQKRVASKKWRLDLVGLCRKAEVNILDVATKSISSIVNEDYVLRHCVPKVTGEAAPQPQSHAPPTGPVRYN